MTEIEIQSKMNELNRISSMICSNDDSMFSVGEQLLICFLKKYNPTNYIVSTPCKSDEIYSYRRIRRGTYITLIAEISFKLGKEMGSLYEQKRKGS